ncbi:hypothetical protein FHY13_001200 [Xanthomonas arboricola]|nr:hypothetical protein [Xanthomonas euroxanthea]
MTPPTLKLLDQLRGRRRTCHDSLHTEQAYVGWIRRFILANGKRHPVQMGRAEVEAFLTEMTTRGQASAGTQNQALAALLFLYREAWGAELPWIENLVRAQRPLRISVVLSAEDSRAHRAAAVGAQGSGDHANLPACSGARGLEGAQPA